MSHLSPFYPFSILHPPTAEAYQAFWSISLLCKHIFLPLLIFSVGFDNCYLMDYFFFLFGGCCSFAIKIHHSCPANISAWYHITVLCKAQVIYCLLFSHFYCSPVPEMLTSVVDSVPGRTLTAASDMIVHSKSAWLNLFPTASTSLLVNPPMAASLIVTWAALVINKTFFWKLN